MKNSSAVREQAAYEKHILPQLERENSPELLRFLQKNFSQRLDEITLQDVKDFLVQHWSRKQSQNNWSLTDLPGVQFKSGLNFRNGLPYLFLMVNGKQIISAWPYHVQGSDWMDTELQYGRWDGGLGFRKENYGT